MLSLPHEFVGFLVAGLRADAFSERDPVILYRIVARERESFADGALVELYGSERGLGAEHKSLLVHNAPPVPDLNTTTMLLFISRLTRLTFFT